MLSRHTLKRLTTALVLLGGFARAGEIEVNSLLNDGEGSLRAAVEEAESTAEPDTIRFVPGLAGRIYLLSPIVLRGNGHTTIEGNTDADGWPTIVLDGSAISSIDWTDYALLSVRSPSNTVRGLGAVLHPVTGIAVFGPMAVGNVVENCVVGTDKSGADLGNGRTPHYWDRPVDWTAAIVVAWGPRETTVRGCVVGWQKAFLGGRGIQAVGVPPSETATRLEGNWVGIHPLTLAPIGNSSAGLVVENSSDVGVTANVVCANGGGIAAYTWGPEYSLQNLQIDRNRVGVVPSADAVWPNGGSGIALWSLATDIDITGNEVFSGNDSAIVVAAGALVRVSSNTVRGVGAGHGVYCQNATGLEVTNNSVRNVPQTGIAVFACPAGVVAANTVEAVGGYGLHAWETHNGEVRGNTIRDSRNNGITLESSTGLVCAGNEITNAGAEGIATGGLANGTIRENTIRSPQQGGIGGWGYNGLAVTDNTVTHPAEAAIRFGWGHDMEVAGNVLSDLRKETLWASTATKTRIAGNAATRAAGGMVVGGGSSDLTIENNTLTDIAGVGIGVWQTSGAEVRGNRVTEKAGGVDWVFGIVVNEVSGACAVTANTVEGFAVGLDAQSCPSLRSTQNRSDAARVHGARFISVDEGCFTDNTLRGAQYTGLECGGLGEEVAIEKNTIEQNNTGIWVNTDWYGFPAETHAMIRRNTVRNNAGTGIWVRGSARGVIEDNHIHGNGSAGISVTDFARFRITANSIHHNGGLGIDLGGDGVTANGPTEQAGGPNDRLRMPEFAATAAAADGYAISGTAPPNSIVEIFSAALDPTEYGEGQTYRMTAEADADGFFSVAIPDALFPVTATASRNGVTSEFSRSNVPPVAAPGDVTVEASDPAGTPVPLDPGRSADPDGDPLEWVWLDADGNEVGREAAPVVTLPVGRHRFTLRVQSADGGRSEGPCTVAVTDTTPPEFLAAGTDPAILWPPNGAAHDVGFTVRLWDNGDPNPTWSVESVRIRGAAQVPAFANTAPLIVRTEAQSLTLRAVPSRNSEDLTYVIRLIAADASGNTSSTEVTVVVPHDQGKEDENGTAVQAADSP